MYKSEQGALLQCQKLGALLQCQNTEQSVVDTIKALGAFKNPITFAYHVGRDLIVNGVIIYHYVICY